MLDELDQQLVHALALDGRASFSRIAAVLGTSVQTVQRRYARLRETVGLRVVAGVDPAVSGDQQWLVRVSASAAGAMAIARALARRQDTSWVRLASGGAEIIAIVTVPADAPASAPQQLLLRDIPRTTGIAAVSAYRLLHLYRGGPSPWAGRLAALDAEQQRALTPPAPSGRGGEPDDADRRLLHELGADGRATLRSLAGSCGLAEATVARRLQALRDDGRVYFDVDLDDAALGVTDRTFLWLTVAPHDLERVATALAGHQQLPLVAATTGASNLVALALTGAPDGLYRYLTEQLAGIDAISAVETAPVLLTVKTVVRPT